MNAHQRRIEFFLGYSRTKGQARCDEPGRSRDIQLLDGPVDRFKVLAHCQLHHAFGTLGRVPQVRVVDELMKIAFGHRINKTESGGLCEFAKVSGGDERHAMSALLEFAPQPDKGVYVPGTPYGADQIMGHGLAVAIAER